jgi:hypothetical protein
LEHGIPSKRKVGWKVTGVAGVEHMRHAKLQSSVSINK